MPNLRSRRPYRASDGDEDEAAPVILDPQEQGAVVDDLVAQAKRSSTLFKRVVLALAVAVFLLLLLPAPVGMPLSMRLLLPLAVLASGFRLFLTLASSVKPTQIDLAILALASLAGLAVLTLSLDTAEKLMWGLAPVGAVLLSLLVQHDAHRALLEAEDLKKLMYNAPEA